MSINSILHNAFTGLVVNQEALRITSNNVANVNTPDYARRIVEQESNAIAGQSGGVGIGQIRRIVDSFLQRESLIVGSATSQFDVEAQIHTRLQTIFGAPDENSSLPGQINNALLSIGELALDVSSAVRRATALADLQGMTNAFSHLAEQIQSIRTDTDRQIAFHTTTLNRLFEQVQEINSRVERELILGGDPAALQDQRDALISEIAEIIDVQAFEQPNGSIRLATKSGFELVGTTRVELSYAAQNVLSTDTVPQPIVATRLNPQTGAVLPPPIDLDPHIGSGELRGLMNMRDATLPALASEIGQLAGAIADQLNAVHNNNSAVPAPNTLVGRNSGLLSGDAHGFSGQSTLAVTASDGTLVSRIDFDFDAGTYSVDGGGAVAIGATVGNLATAINASLGANGSASFVNGVLTVQATGVTDGVSFIQDATNPSGRIGRGLSHFFGLNDLVTASQPSTFQTGLSGAEAHGFTPGDTIEFMVRHPDGQIATELTLVVGGATIGDIVTALNNPVTGLGSFMSFSLNANGELTSTNLPTYDGFDLLVKGDNTSRGGTGVSFTELFGLGTRYMMEQAKDMKIVDRIISNSDEFSLAQLDIAGAIAGDLVLSPADNRGVLDMELIANQPISFGPAGNLASATTTLGDYASLKLADMGDPTPLNAATLR